MSTEVAERKKEGEGTRRETFVRPPFETLPGKDAYELRVRMPGVSRSGVDVAVVDDELTIVGRREDRVPAGWRPVVSELQDVDYRLRVRLNLKVDQEKIAARVEDGILTLQLPIRDAARPRSIEVH